MAPADGYANGAWDPANGGVCVTFDGGGSFIVYHLLNRVGNGHVARGQQLGTVAPAWQAGNRGYAHAHLELHSGGCGSAMVSFSGGARFECAPDMTYSGQVNQWAGQALTRNCGGESGDRDGDGVPDASDRCPDQPGSAATGGCPDTDGDTVADLDDKCPERGEPVEEGCPAEVGVPIDGNGDRRVDLVHRWSQGVNTWLSNGDGTYAVKGFQAHAGYGYAQGVWPSTSTALIAKRQTPAPGSPPASPPAHSPSAGRPGKIARIRFKRIGPRRVLVRWSTVAGATSYEYRVVTKRQKGKWVSTDGRRTRLRILRQQHGTIRVRALVGRVHGPMRSRRF